MYASRVLGIALCAVGLTSSSLFGYPFITPKFILLALAVFGISLLCFVQPTKLVLPKIKNIEWLLYTLLLCVIISAFAQVPAERATGFAHVVMSLLLIWATASFVRSEKSENFLYRFLEAQVPFLIFMFVVLAYQAFITRIPPVPFFHGQNIAAGFVAIATLQFYFWGQENKNLLLKRISYFFVFLGVALVVYYNSRAALLGLSAALIFAGVGKNIFLQLLPKKLSPSFRKGALWSLGILLLVGAYFVFLQKGIASLAIRFSFWGNTLCLIKDHPFGIGPGAFEYVFHAYNGLCFPGQEVSEGQLIDHPHNMFLEFMAEIGILGFLLLGGIFYFIYRDFYKSSAKESLTFKWLNSSLLLILFNALFEFPQGTAYSLFYLSIVLGVLCASTKTISKNPSYFKSLHLALSFLVAAVFLIKGASNILTLRTDIKDNFFSACALDKENWRACYRVAIIYLEERNFEGAQKSIDDLASNFEGHYAFSALKGFQAEQKGDLQGACKFYREYDARFGNKSMLSKDIATKCPKSDAAHEK